jgi:hypothetical protein
MIPDFRLMQRSETSIRENGAALQNMSFYCTETQDSHKIQIKFEAAHGSREDVSLRYNPHQLQEYPSQGK